MDVALVGAVVDVVVVVVFVVFEGKERWESATDGYM